MMKLFFDLFPLVLFFVAYKMGDIYVATATLMVAMALQVSFLWIKNRKVEKVYLYSLLAVLVFGGLTLILRNDVFIKWKPSVFNWGFGMVFLLSPLVGGQPLVKRMMGAVLELSDAGWHRLNWAWVLFFVVSGVANIVVAYTMSKDAWVNFKVMGLTAMSLIFVIGQVVVLRNHLVEPPGETAADEDGESTAAATPVVEPEA